MSTKDIVFSAAGGEAPIEGDFLYAWGQNYAGNWGNGFAQVQNVQTLHPYISNVVEVNGDQTTLAVTSDGKLWTWGNGGAGALGINDGSAFGSTPVQVGSLTTWVSIGSANNGMFAIKNDGTLWSWGEDQYGRLGQSTVNVSKSSPTQVGALTNWDSVSVSTHQVLALKTDGTIWSWGQNNSGCLGTNNGTNYSSPVQIGAGTDWAYVAAGFASSFAIKTDGTLWSWGYNSAGANGQNSTAQTSSPTQVGALTNWAKVVPSTLSTSGQNFTLAIKTDGTLWAWGYNQYGELGDNTIIWKSSPVQIGSDTDWLDIACRSSNNSDSGISFALKTDGSIWQWGRSNFYNGDGLYSGMTQPRSSPVQIGAGPYTKIFAKAASNSIYNTWLTTSSGDFYTFGLHQPSNNRYQLGLGKENFLSDSPVQVGTNSEWLMVSSGQPGVGVTAGIKGNNTLWTWGTNLYGNGGTNNISYPLTPVQVGTGKDWAQVVVGIAHTLAIKTDGTLWAWGLGQGGRVGDGTVIDRSSPVQIGAGTDWAFITASDAASFAIKTNGTLWSWGLNTEGVLGQGNLTSLSSPTQIGALSNWANVDCGTYTVHAVKTDGTLWAWGIQSIWGQFGNNSRTNASSPVQIGSQTDWARTFHQQQASLFIKTNGTLYAVGYNGTGGGGTNNTISRSSPVQVGALTNWLNGDGTTSQHSSFAIKTDGTLWSWGQNAEGLLGDGTAIDRSSPVQIGSLTTWTQVSAGRGGLDYCLALSD